MEIANNDVLLLPERPTNLACDVLVIGGGPSGASAAFWLASNGYDTLLVEKKTFPREKTCGDGLTPRSLRQLFDMGMTEPLSFAHKYFGLRTRAFGKELTMDWPKVPGLPEHGYVITRYDLDELVLANTEKTGAKVWQACEAIAAEPKEDHVKILVKDKQRDTVSEITARYLIIAEGANARIGRSLQVKRNRQLPFGLAIRGYYSSPRSHDPYIESQLDIRDENNLLLPGYGWIFPLGDGRVNVGIGLVSTMAKWKEVNTTNLLNTFTRQAPSSWGLSPESRIGEPTGGKLPMGMSSSHLVGQRYLVVGDAGGLINPFNGEGIAYGYESGRLAAAAISEAFAGDNPALLYGYNDMLDMHYGSYYKVARLFLRLMGNPEVLRILISTGMYSKTVMTILLKIMSNLMSEDDIGIAETILKVAAKLSKNIPE
ncbi:MAG: geranylgeranyl reductase family protein [Firmicutes bacterium]|nr:geranylgeranyl reductase family protein [Bacillota bacterium]